MAIIKCKMCGGDLSIAEGESVCDCEYCGTRQTIPAADNEKKLTLFARANRLRLASEFDKAFGIYESIAAEFPEEAEAYWGLVLCKYGVEYVDDPDTGKKIPTCHRISFDSVMEDADFEQACENADSAARRVYREEAKQIEEIRKDFLEISGREEPYDIFICYKETDENGDRTLDSVLAEDVYEVLTNKGYRVFFSQITLADKPGRELEPYIFAALNSAKVMLAVGTDYEYYNAVWVKNEWSRYLKLMAEDKEKHLIPCYKNLDAYDMPKEFTRLQSQDLDKAGATQDLLRGIEKLLGNSVMEEPQNEQMNSVRSDAPEVQSLLKRGQLFLEAGDWSSADESFNKALDIDPECSEAYLCKTLSDYKLPSRKRLVDRVYELENNKNFLRVLQLGGELMEQDLNDLKLNADALIKSYHEEYKEYKLQCDKIKKDRALSIDAEIINQKNIMQKKIQEEYQEKIDTKTEYYNRLKKKKSDAMTKRSNLKFFQAFEKQGIEQEILELEEQLQVANKTIRGYAILHDECEKECEKNMVIIRKKAILSIHSKMPLPAIPPRPECLNSYERINLTSYEILYNDCKELICRYMDYGEEYTADEILKEIEKNEDADPSCAERILKQMVHENVLKVVQNENNTCYCLNL